METIPLKFSLLGNIALRNDTRSVLSTADRNSPFFLFYYVFYLGLTVVSVGCAQRKITGCGEQRRIKNDHPHKKQILKSLKIKLF